jgi:hypothetical protein
MDIPMSDETPKHFYFTNRDKQVPPLIELANNAPELSWTLTHYVEILRSNSKFPTTQADHELLLSPELITLLGAELSFPYISKEIWLLLGLAIKQLQEEGVVSLQPLPSVTNKPSEPPELSSIQEIKVHRAIAILATA